MADDQNEIHAGTDAARAGSTPNIVRWVLGLSLVAAIVLLSLVWITGTSKSELNKQFVDYPRTAEASSAASEAGKTIAASPPADRTSGTARTPSSGN